MPFAENGEDLIGAVLRQRWRILRVIGAGGLGLVFEVEDARQSQHRAAKLLRQEFSEEPLIVERFLAEALAAGRVEHSGIPRVIECDRAEDGTPYLVMELLTGEPLSAAMNRGRLPVERAAAIASGILDTLTAAHGVGVVHRDLKPDNVFLVDESGSTRVKVLDFGLARVMDVAGGPARKTRTGMLLGTPGYMAPEQVRNAKSAGVAADLWSVGIILYEMLTGVRAFAAANEFERLNRVLNDRPTPIEQVAPQYAHWSLFFERALAFKPEERFASAAEMNGALAQAKGGHLSQRPSALVAVAQPRLPPDVSAGVPDAVHITPPAEQQPVGRPVFGGVDTAVSAGSSLPPAAMPPSSGGVKVVQLPARGVPVWLTVALTLAALGFGLVAGFVLGSQ